MYHTSIMSCLICLEEESLRSRCSRCSVKSCLACHEKLLGFCCICDRHIICRPFECFHCNTMYPIYEMQSMDDSLFFMCKKCYTSDNSDDEYVPSGTDESEED